ncbi:hypothetical protein HYH03_001346 [Edaphochlamys debaryana]|uniref:Proteasome assembly chaperone 3 n=1 Tax=Edaphochlamys debaryana TaxID=47281 RepID=A0A836C4V5_9CHLO|nr:hypothetical protein HYH03_001346 [Edaphochlamys debaryana]|eukprot:KAG2500576.1 hypothetical protein HYH03_001346 [Edaphochlamys debaryana]
MEGRSTFTSSVVLGRRDDAGLELAARQLVEALGQHGHSKPVTLCLGLKEPSPAVVRELVAAVHADNVWGPAPAS